MSLARARSKVYAAWRRAGLRRGCRPEAWYRYGAEVVATARGIEISGHVAADLPALIGALAGVVAVSIVDGFVVIGGAS